MYKTEQKLVTQFNKSLKCNSSPFPINNTASEFNYISGIVDLIANLESDELVAFEAKITRWKDALNQAYRCSSFAHYSYVVIPQSEIPRALKRKHEFEFRGIGLCGIEKSIVKIELPAVKKEPLLPWLTKRARLHIASI